MYEDPIVNEVRKTRERLMDEAGGYDAYIRKLIGMEEKHSERQVSHLPENLGRAIVITPPPMGVIMSFSFSCRPLLPGADVVANDVVGPGHAGLLRPSP